MKKFMMRNVSAFAAVLQIVALSACGVPRSTVLKQPDDLAAVKVREASLAPIEVTSTEDDSDSLAMNEEWRRLAQEELQAFFAKRQIAEKTTADAIIACRIRITYGNRALRYFVSFGAGSGHMDVTIELKDRNGRVLYATSSKANLSVGIFGGSMSYVARETIQKAVNDFGSRL
jgi:hypothetical protein